jgi:hypothetical protein
MISLGIMDGCLPGNGVRDGVELNQMCVTYRDISPVGWAIFLFLEFF